MHALFQWCSDLKDLNVENWNTENVTDMSFMFSSCESIEKLDIISFNTRNVSNICCMFNNVGKDEPFELIYDSEKFDTSNVKYFGCFMEDSMGDWKTEFGFLSGKGDYVYYNGVLSYWE